MNYLEEVKQRSVILWQAVFAAQSDKGAALPVYIDGAPGTIVPGGEKQREEAVQVAAPAAETPYPMEAAQGAERVLRGVEDSAAAVESVRAVQQKTAQSALAEKEENGTAQTPPSAAEGHTAETLSGSGFSEWFAFAGEGLLSRLRGTEETALRAKEGQSTATEPSSGAVEERMDGAQWSDWFERDARRYDGACQIM